MFIQFNLVCIYILAIKQSCKTTHCNQSIFLILALFFTFSNSCCATLLAPLLLRTERIHFMFCSFSWNPVIRLTTVIDSRFKLPLVVISSKDFNRLFESLRKRLVNRSETKTTVVRCKIVIQRRVTDHNMVHYWIRQVSSYC